MDMVLPFDRGSLDEALAEIDAWRDRLDRKGPLLSRRWAGRLRSDLEAEAIAASTRLEGVAVTVDDVRRILASDPPPQVARRDRELVSGYRDAMTYVLRRADDPNFEWNRELMIGIQDRVLAGRFEDGAGRLREKPTWIVSRDDGRVVFEPPSSGVPALIDDVCSTFTQLDAHPAIAAAWLHVALGAVHPFADGNGRTARVLASLVMYRGGFRMRAFTTLEEWWGRHSGDYYAAFSCLGRHFDASANVTPFIEAHVGAQVSQIRAYDLRERTQRRLWTLIENLVIDHELPDRLTNALWDAFFGREVNAGYYRGVTDVSAPTATNDLKAAMGAKLLTGRGERRWRRYDAGPQLLREIGDQLGLAEISSDPHAARSQVIADLTQRLTAPADSDRTQATLFS